MKSKQKALGTRPGGALLATPRESQATPLQDYLACYLEFPLGRLAKRFHILSRNEAGSHRSRGRTDLSRRSRRCIWHDRRRDLFQYLDDRLSRSAYRSFLSRPNRRNDLSVDRKLRRELARQ